MNEIINKISNLAFYGFYDPSKEMVIIHFFNEEQNKSDVIAYLKRDMSWDVREILREESVLQDDCEYITVHHKPLGVFSRGSDFDSFVRTGITQSSKKLEEEGVQFINADKMLKILNDNRY